MTTEDPGIEVERRYDDNGLLRYEGRTRNGLLHSVGGPARRLFQQGLIISEKWFYDGNLHRDGDEPSFVRYVSGTTDVCLEEWHQHGQLHRIGKPASIRYHNGRRDHIVYEGWSVHGKKHCEIGPAVILRLVGGSVIEKWFLDGEEMTKEEWEMRVRVVGETK